MDTQVPVTKQEVAISPTINEEKKKRGEACLQEIALALQKYRCKQNIVVRIDLMAGISGEVIIIPE